MSSLFIFLSFLFVTGLNQPEPRTLNISTTTEIQLPADRIQFNITVNARAENPQEAYEMHQRKEKTLVQLLEKYNIGEENIKYEPISIRENRERIETKGIVSTYRTRQTVNVTFSDFDIYEKIQISLIENGFDQFNGIFLSSNQKEGKDKALRKAIQKTKAKAQLIAEEAGVTLGPITHISYSAHPVRPYAESRVVTMKAAGSSDLLEYNQTVTITANVSMEFEIEG